MGASKLIGLNEEFGDIDGIANLEIVPNVAEKPVFDKELNLYSPLKVSDTMSNADMLYCRVAHRAYRRWSLFDLMINNLFWRHTKVTKTSLLISFSGPTTDTIVQVSTKGELTIPAVVEELILRDFSDVERAMYVNALKEGSESKS